MSLSVSVGPLLNFSDARFYQNGGRIQGRPAYDMYCAYLSHVGDHSSDELHLIQPNEWRVWRRIDEEQWHNLPMEARGIKHCGWAFPVFFDYVSKLYGMNTWSVDNEGNIVTDEEFEESLKCDEDAFALFK